MLDFLANPILASTLCLQLSQQRHFGRLSVRQVESYLMSDSSITIPSLSDRLVLVGLIIVTFSAKEKGFEMSYPCDTRRTSMFR